MAKLELFIVAALLHPEVKGKEGNTEDTQLIFGPENMLAKTNVIAGQKVVRKLPSEYEDVLDRVEIIVRPF